MVLTMFKYYLLIILGFYKIINFNQGNYGTRNSDSERKNPTNSSGYFKCARSN